MPLGRAQKFALAGLAGLTAFFVGKKAFAKPTPTGTLGAGCDPSPFQWREASTRQAIENEIEDGNTDALEVAKSVAESLYSDYPGGGHATYPPAAPALKGVDCIWSRVTSLVQTIFAEKGIVPGGGGPKKPWEIVDPWVKKSPDPRDGFLYQIQYGKKPEVSGMYALVKKVLQNAGVPDTVANQKQYCKLVECSPWNDALYNVPDAGCKSGPNGRGVTLNPRHADNLPRMEQGQPPKRTAISKTKGPGGGHHALLWLPKIEHGAPVPTVAPNEDGTNGINPPKDILDFGLENVPAGNYGCEPWSSDAEPLEF